ncbi:MAG TPA: hypothetical protein VF932_06675 [Anaerolineae bacterium]
MSTRIRIPRSRLWVFLVLAVLLALPLTGCSQFVGDNNFTLGGGETVSGDLIAPSSNVRLEQGSRVTGSTIMLCCNLNADGEIDGNIVMVAGNVMTGPNALIRGRLIVISGNVLRGASVK